MPTSAAIAAYKDLCLDATDAERVASFWAKAIGGELGVQSNGDAVVRGLGFGRLWVNVVPERKVVKNRVHLDVRTPSIDPLLDLGATVIDAHDGWTVLADPEGNELCAFPGDVHGPGPVEAFALCVDSDEPEALASWWQAILGGEVGTGSDGAPRWLHGAAGLGGLTMKFVRVGDERSVKNRCHWDVDVAHVDDLVARGATVLAEPSDDCRWTVLADPQGNEFCAFTADG